MKEQLISFETAQLFKEKGGNFRCFPWNYGCYRLEDKQLINRDVMTKENQIGEGHLPSLELLHKWLREIHGIYLLIIPTITSAWTFKNITVISERDNDVILGIKSVSDLPPYDNVHGYDYRTYEEALEAGLQEGLKLIK